MHVISMANITACTMPDTNSVCRTRSSLCNDSIALAHQSDGHRRLQTAVGSQQLQDEKEDSKSSVEDFAKQVLVRQVAQTG